MWCLVHEHLLEQCIVERVNLCDDCVTHWLSFLICRLAKCCICQLLRQTHSAIVASFVAAHVRRLHVLPQPPKRGQWGRGGGTVPGTVFAIRAVPGLAGVAAS